MYVVCTYIRGNSDKAESFCIKKKNVFIKIFGLFLNLLFSVGFSLVPTDGRKYKIKDDRI